MISVSLTTPMLNSILVIEQCKTTFQGDRVPPRLSSRMRKNSKKKSSHASTKIEGNPLTEEQAEQALEDVHRHFLKPEEEVRNYYAALQIMEERLGQETPLPWSCSWRFSAPSLPARALRRSACAVRCRPGCCSPSTTA